MGKALVSTVVGVAVLAMATNATAQLKAEESIKFRQSGYTFMAWNMGKIKAQVVDETVPYDKDQVIAAARVIASTANSGMGALYAPGTDSGKGWKETRLKPEFFDELDEVGKIAKNFSEQATKLEEVANTGDVAMIKAQFGEVGEACKACHDKYRIEED